MLDPERPWWRPARYPGNWVRTDGLTTDVDLIEALDRDDPLQPPPPKCGQVWVDFFEGDWYQASTVLDVTRTGHNDNGDCFEVLTSKGDTFLTWELDSDGAKQWPPPGAVLVAGPHSPWAPE